MMGNQPQANMIGLGNLVPSQNMGFSQPLMAGGQGEDSNPNTITLFANNDADMRHGFVSLTNEEQKNDDSQ